MVLLLLSLYFRRGTEETHQISEPVTQWTVQRLSDCFEGNNSHCAVKDTEAFGQLRICQELNKDSTLQNKLQ
jgi:hypothetical protein